MGVENLHGKMGFLKELLKKVNSYKNKKKIFDII